MNTTDDSIFLITEKKKEVLLNFFDSINVLKLNLIRLLRKKNRIFFNRKHINTCQIVLLLKKKKNQPKNDRIKYIDEIIYQ